MNKNILKNIGLVFLVNGVFVTAVMGHSTTIPDPSCTESGLLADINDDDACVDESYTTSGGIEADPWEVVQSEKRTKILEADGKCNDEGSTTGVTCSPSQEQFLYDFKSWDGATDCPGDPTWEIFEIPVDYTEASTTNCPPIHEPHAKD